MARIGVVVWMVILFLVLPFGRQVLELYTDWLWFDEVGFSGVFSTILWTKTLLSAAAGIVAFLVLYLNLLATRGGHGRWSSSRPRTTCPSFPAGARWNRSTSGSSFRAVS